MNYGEIAAVHAAAVDEVWSVRQNQEAALEAQRAAELYVLKGSIEKVYFAYTLQQADAAQVDLWAQQLNSGISAEILIAGVRNSLESIYFGASASKSINDAFKTLFGRAATLGETLEYSGVDPALIPAMVALKAAGSDADTLNLRQQFAAAIKGYYEANELPLTYGLPAMKAKEQMLTLVASDSASSLVEKAVREMSDFLSEWKRVADKPQLTDIDPPRGRYVWEGTDYDVVFYEPPVEGGFGRLIFPFKEPVDWSSMDFNRDGKLEIGSELNLILSNPAILGNSAEVSVKIGVSDLTIDLGSGAVAPVGFSLLADYDYVVVAGVADYQGNAAGTLFAFHV